CRLWFPTARAPLRCTPGRGYPISSYTMASRPLAMETAAMLRLADLREILRYVPQYRDKTFVIALDGAVVEEGNFRNLLLDIALLRSLRVEVALVHGCGFQIRRLAEQTGQQASNIDGTGVTDYATLP